jgi:chromosome segregation ATPase
MHFATDLVAAHPAAAYFISPNTPDHALRLKQQESWCLPTDRLQFLNDNKDREDLESSYIDSFSRNTTHDVLNCVTGNEKLRKARSELVDMIARDGADHVDRVVKHTLSSVKGHESALQRQAKSSGNLLCYAEHASQKAELREREVELKEEELNRKQNQMELQEQELRERAQAAERLRQVLIQKHEELHDAQEQIRFCSRNLAAREKKHQEREHRLHSLVKRQTAEMLKEHDESLAAEEKALDEKVAKWLRKQKKKAGLGGTARTPKKGKTKKGSRTPSA